MLLSWTMITNRCYAVDPRDMKTFWPTHKIVTKKGEMTLLGGEKELNSKNVIEG